MSWYSVTAELMGFQREMETMSFYIITGIQCCRTKTENISSSCMV